VVEMVIDEGGEFLPAIGIQMNGTMDVPGLIERPEVVIVHGSGKLMSSEDVVNQLEFIGTCVVIGFLEKEEEHRRLGLRKELLPGTTCSTKVGGTGDEGFLGRLFRRLLGGGIEGHVRDDTEMISVLFGELSGKQFNGVSGMDFYRQEVTGQEFDVQGEGRREFGGRMKVSNGMSFFLMKTLFAIQLLALLGPHSSSFLMGMTSTFQFQLKNGEMVICLVEVATKGDDTFLRFREFLLNHLQTVESGLHMTLFGAGDASDSQTETSGFMSGLFL
jgi:hypothetical protein